ncbi:MAG: uL15 family ribosomal protein [Desulfurococcaceae archaeon]|uniref:Large ribosomal subunit protein uL15 n=1 Tax=Staphylothermus marinus TaxID=2280 RepID=A0A7C4NRE8_STAMA
MVVRKRRKSRKLRGRTRTMGWGRVGQHRKSGSRGGFGAVGFHKHKWIWVKKYAPDWYGKHGFTPPKHSKELVKPINLEELESIVSKLMNEEKLSIENGKVIVNLKELGFNKVLGRGRISIPIKLIAPYVSERAREKIVEAGGEVVEPSS